MAYHVATRSGQEDAMTQRRVPVTFVLALLVIAALATTAGAQIAVSGNDNKVLLVNGGPAAIRTAEK
jgi:hypothetical protein